MKYLLFFLFVFSFAYSDTTKYKGIIIKYDDCSSGYKIEQAIDYLIKDGLFSYFKKSGVYKIVEFDGVIKGKEYVGYTYGDGIILVKASYEYKRNLSNMDYDLTVLYIETIIMHEVLHNLYWSKPEDWIETTANSLCTSWNNY